MDCLLSDIHYLRTPISAITLKIRNEGTYRVLEYESIFELENVKGYKAGGCLRFLDW